MKFDGTVMNRCLASLMGICNALVQRIVAASVYETLRLRSQIASRDNFRDRRPEAPLGNQRPKWFDLRLNILRRE